MTGAGPNSQSPGHGPTPPEGGTYYHWREASHLQPFLYPQVRRMTILLQWTYYILLHRTQMLLAELMFAMYGNANYEPDGDIILESTQIIPQTDEDCLDLVFDEPSWIAQKHRKIGII
ncbi:hypothetical protein AVEN_39129-1 [Araneus ventricosus]|uniref:Uncharacterized protein n=1 Tax=Araneus ventricosus TaxID=182803 RepID=A0A4Y2LJ25_ARAVE|nr:hypothetical protein AVEN_39129-1 [Araneus ventricosus]